MNNIKTFFFIATFLIAGLQSHASFSQDMPVTEETVTLELGVVDTQEYGRNFGRDGNMAQLDVSFTAVEDLNHRLSWQVFDIERDEMLIFLNDTQIRKAVTTRPNSLGSVDGITILSADLAAGSNVLSFRVPAGDGTWGVTNLSAESIAANVDGEPATTVLLDAPDQDGSAFGGSSTTEFTFNFSPRGEFYEETISISFDSYVAFDGVNGFELSLNGRVVKRVNNYRGRATFIKQTVVLDKSEVLDGENTIRIRIITPNGGAFIDGGFANVEVISSSLPLLDVSVKELSLGDVDNANRSIEVSAVIDNIGAKASLPTTLTFFVSRSEDKSKPITIANASVMAISGGSSETIVQAIQASELRRGRFLWACIDRVAEDLDAANDCSPVIELAGGSSITTPAVMLLLDD